MELGAFRTYPQGYKPADEGPQEYQSIPLSKIEDFGVHCKQYYPLDVSYFKSTRDSQLLSLLWNRYWVNTLSSNALFAVSPLSPFLLRHHSPLVCLRVCVCVGMCVMTEP